MTCSRLKNATKVWCSLKTKRSPKGHKPRELELLSKLQYLKNGMSSLSQHLRDFKSICEQLNAIGKPVPDKNKVLWLGPKY